MLVHKHSEERALASSQVSVVPSAFIEHYISQLRLNLLDPSQVLLSKLDSLLRIVLELESLLILVKVLTCTKGIGNLSVSLLFPATCITLNRWSVWIRLASDFDPFGIASTVDSKFGLAWRIWTRLIWMTISHALVSALLPNLHASLATTILVELFNAIEAFTSRMANASALMTTRQGCITDLTTVRSASVTKFASKELFTTVAESCNELKARWTVAIMTSHGAWMAAWKLFLARAFAGWWLDATFNWWVKLCDSTRTIKRLSRHDFARWTEANMAEFGAIVLFTLKLLVTLNHAEMKSIWIRALILNRAANLITLMLLALFKLITDFFAPEILDFVHLFTCHPFLPQCVRIIHFVAWKLGLSLFTDTGHVD